MRITIKIEFQNNKQCSGMRQWARYVLDETFKLMKNVKEAEHDKVRGYVIGDTFVSVSFQVDGTGRFLEVTLDSALVDSKKPLNAPPVPAMVFLMALLHMTPGRARAGTALAFECTIGAREYKKEQVADAYTALKAMVPEGWYVPYAMKVKDPIEFFRGAAAK